MDEKYVRLAGDTFKRMRSLFSWLRIYSNNEKYVQLAQDTFKWMRSMFS